jgi:hypothetical protein
MSEAKPKKAAAKKAEAPPASAGAGSPPEPTLPEAIAAVRAAIGRMEWSAERDAAARALEKLARRAALLPPA